MIKNNRTKNLIRALIAIFVFVSVFLLCEKILLLKSEDGIEQMRSFYKQDENSIDVLFMGNSHGYCNINTGILWDEYGMAAFDLGGAEQPYWNTYYFFKEALKTQRPELILFSASVVGINPTDHQPEVWLVTNLYGMKWNMNRIRATRVSAYEDKFFTMLFPVYTMHSRYNELTERDFTEPNNDISYKGFDPRNGNKAFDTPDISDITEIGTLTEKEDKYLRMIFDLAKEEGIPFGVFIAPYVVNEEAQMKYNYVFSIAGEYGFPCMDFNKQYDEMGLDFQTDMYEGLHLNYPGNEKFTKYLGQVILNEYDIPDRRGEAGYASWEEDARKQREDREAVLAANSDKE